MHKFAKRSPWLLILLLAGLSTVQVIHSKEASVDFTAEDKQAAKEDEQDVKDRAAGIKGKRQRTFLGTFTSLPGDNKNLSPDVVGTFDTNDSDKKPGRHYLVKVQDRNQAVIDMLNKMAGKSSQVTGTLRNIDQNGEAKYLHVVSVITVSATPPVVEHRKLGGL